MLKIIYKTEKLQILIFIFLFFFIFFFTMGGKIEPTKPKLRGISHAIIFFISIFTGWWLVEQAPSFMKLPAFVYACIFSMVFGVSAFLHVPNWPPDIRRLLRQLDHCMIFLLIAATYNLFPILPESGYLIIWVGWLGAFFGILYKICMFSTIEKGSKLLTSLPYAILGWAILIELPNISYHLEYVGFLGLFCICIAGACYTIGALCYTIKKPNLFPGIFGYHEMLHFLVIIANYLFYTCVLITFQSWYRINNNI